MAALSVESDLLLSVQCLVLWPLITIFFNTFLPLRNSRECLELVIYHSLYLEYFPHTFSWARALTHLVSLRTRVISSGSLDSALLSILALFVLLPCEPTSYFLYGNCLTNCLIFFPIPPLSWEL